jgi:hypothetical protein
MKYLAFDIETAKILDDMWYCDWRNGHVSGPFYTEDEAEAKALAVGGEAFKRCIDLDKARPLGIACAGLMRSDVREIEVWHGVDSPGQPAYQMAIEDVHDLVVYMHLAGSQGYTSLGFNSLSFDIRTLAEESGLWGECRDLAMNHVDIMFAFFCQRGHRIKLDVLAKGMGMAGKSEDMDGGDAPKLWRLGEHGKVIDYLEQDVRQTLELAETIEREVCYRWTSQRGYDMEVPLAGGRLLTVQESLDLPLPDTGWMTTNPQTRESFFAWIEGEGAPA